MAERQARPLGFMSLVMDFIVTIWQAVTAWFAHFFGEVFSFRRRVAVIRFLSFTLLGLLIWVLYALIVREVEGWGSYFFALGNMLTFWVQEQPFAALALASAEAKAAFAPALGSLLAAMFSAPVLRPLLAFTLPMVIALKISTVFIKNVWNLDKERTALRFFIQAFSGLFYQRLIIENGAVNPRQTNLPMLRIGGPGKVQVNLENAAVFEESNGHVDIIAPTVGQFRQAQHIISFERLRQVVDLRDQIIQNIPIVIHSRTRDGIPLVVEGIRLNYSILRDPRNHLEYSFSEVGLRNLIYDSPHGETTGKMIGMVRYELANFISQNSLEKFLAAADITGEDAASQPSPMLHFVPRTAAFECFRNKGFIQRAWQNGLQLNWIDIGAWSTPARFVTEKHHEAWRISCENLERRREIDLKRMDARGAALMQLLLHYPLKDYQSNALDGLTQHQKYSLLRTYMALLSSAAATYPEDAPAPDELNRAIIFLSNYVNQYVQDTNQAHYMKED